MNGIELVPAELQGWINAPEDRIRRDVEHEAQRQVIEALGRVACATRAAALAKLARDAVPAVQGEIKEREAGLPALQRVIDAAQVEYGQAVKLRKAQEGSRGEAAAEAAEAAAFTVLDRARVARRIADNELASLRQAARELDRVGGVLGSMPAPDMGLLGDVLRAVPARSK